MSHGIKTIIIPVRDLTAAKVLYGTVLGVEPYADEPYYVGFRVADLEFGLDPNGHAKGMTGPVVYWRVDDLEANLDALVAAGAQVQQPVQDVGGGRRIVTLTDADGNPIGLLHDAPEGPK